MFYFQESEAVVPGRGVGAAAGGGLAGDRGAGAGRHGAGDIPAHDFGRRRPLLPRPVPGADQRWEWRLEFSNLQLSTINRGCGRVGGEPGCLHQAADCLLERDESERGRAAADGPLPQEDIPCRVQRGVCPGGCGRYCV